MLKYAPENLPQCTMKTLYPDITPFDTFYLDTSSNHKIYVEQSGNPDGIPVVFLHGGPCSGTKPDHRCFFNPKVYRIILFDQRGCGKSLPFGELVDNHTAALLEDLENIRIQLHIRQWLLFGGSWGATLALLYAQQHPKHVSALIIRGVFLARKTDLDWFIETGANKIYPEQWQRLMHCIPKSHAANLLHELYTALESDDELTQRRIAKEWNAWNAQVALGNAFQVNSESQHVHEHLVKQVRMEVNYAYHNYFIAENQILKNCDRLQHIPTIIIHGRNDLVCPLEAADSLHKALPHAQYIVLPHSGHIAKGDEMLNALVSATDNMALLLSS